jgi:hypothetical protein
MKEYKASCHCGAIRFTFSGPDKIENGLRCNCSICRRKGALMSAFTLAPKEMEIEVDGDQLATYAFGSGVAKHHFCKNCGIYPFHQTMRKPGHFRINLGCVEELGATRLPYEVFDGASI